jgi:monovalent cation:H+ antiporter-2, CPA2 family
MHDVSTLRDIVLVFGAAVVVVLLLARLGLPSIAGLIVSGIAIGPHALGLVGDVGRVDTLAEVGVVLLLFGIGLEMPLERLRRLWRPIIIGGALQVVLTGLGAYALARGLGLGVAASAVVAFVAIPSSTAIVLRGLDARGETDAPHGRLMLGILLFQDLSVVPMMLLLPALTGEATGGLRSIVLSLGKSAVLLALVVLAARLLVPRVLRLVAASRQRDAFVLAVFLVCVGTAWAASSAGVSLALGAFLAGVVVAGSDYRHQAMSDVIPLREVLASLFFVSVGMLLDLRLLVTAPGRVLGLFVTLLAAKFAVVVVAAAMMRLPLRVAVLAGAGLAQAGEFSLVLLRSLRGRGPLAADAEGLLLAAAILSMVVTPLLLAIGPRLAAGAERLPMIGRLFGVKSADEASLARGSMRGHVVIAGYGVAGRTLAARLVELGRSFLVVDLNPLSVSEASQRGILAYYGDVTSQAVLAHLGLEHACQFVLLINDPRALERAVVAARGVAPKVHIIARSRYAADESRLRALGANDVIAAEVEAGRAVMTQVVG